MNCKFCDAELPVDVTLCPVCGKENVEELAAEEIAAEETVAEETAVVEMDAEEIPEVVADEAQSEELTEEADAPKKPKTWKIILAVAGIVAALAVLAGAVLYGTGAFDKAKTYTVADEKAIKAPWLLPQVTWN